MSCPAQLHYAVIRTDEHGTKYLIAQSTTSAGANDRLRTILDRHTKPHHQAYDILPYTPGTWHAVAEREHIKC